MDEFSALGALLTVAIALVGLTAIVVAFFRPAGLHLTVRKRVLGGEPVDPPEDVRPARTQQPTGSAVRKG